MLGLGLAGVLGNRVSSYRCDNAQASTHGDTSRRKMMV